MQRVAVLGSTGSIGTSTLDVIAGYPERLSVFGLAAHSRIEILEAQIRRHQPQVVVVLDQGRADELRRRCPHATIWAGLDGLQRLVTHADVDTVVVGTSGAQSLLPLFAAIEAGKQIALASKELLVMAGSLIMPAVRARGVRFMPVDSEHAALAQALQGVPREQVARLIVTGSGGPLWSLDAAATARISREQVLRHPKWSMGPKITVDSATLMNKGLEVIEAHWLFEMPLEQLSVVIHPQAVVHGLVEMVDGSMLAQMSACDMRLPIQHALSVPERWPSKAPRLQLTQLSALEFFEPDLARFPCLGLAWEAARRGGTACAVLSAANDVAVDAYLQGEIAFSEIPSVIRQTLAGHQTIVDPTLDDILAADRWARDAARALAHPAPMAGEPVRHHEPVLPRS